MSHADSSSDARFSRFPQAGLTRSQSGGRRKQSRLTPMKNKLFSLAALCIMACISEPGYADVRDGLVAYWPMDVFTNNVTPDMSPNANDLTDNFSMSGADFVASPRGNAASFDGVSKYLSRAYT